MLVVLRIISASEPGRHVQIRGDQVLKVGRSGWADLCIAGDSKLLDIHFTVQATADGCIVESLDKRGPTLVNGKPISSIVVYDGDLIEAGSTKFQLTIEGGASKPSEPPPEEKKSTNPTGDTATAAAALGLVGVCAYLEFADDIKPLASAATDGDELINQLVLKKKYQDAIRLRAYLLDKRQAVFWASLCLKEVSDVLPSDQDAPLAAAEAWVKEPTEERRRASEKAAADSKYSGPGATLALSAFWSDGSLSPEGSDEVPPDDRLTSQGVTASLVMAAYLGEPTQAESRFKLFLTRGKAIADGSVPLPVK